MGKYGIWQTRSWPLISEEALLPDKRTVRPISQASTAMAIQCSVALASSDVEHCSTLQCGYGARHAETQAQRGCRRAKSSGKMTSTVLVGVLSFWAVHDANTSLTYFVGCHTKKTCTVLPNTLQLTCSPYPCPLSEKPRLLHKDSSAHRIEEEHDKNAKYWFR